MVAIKDQDIKNYALRLIVHKATKEAVLFSLKKKKDKMKFIPTNNPSVYKQPIAPFHLSFIEMSVIPSSEDTVKHL